MRFGFEIVTSKDDIQCAEDAFIMRIGKELKVKIRILLHKMKNVSMTNRIQGMMMADVIINHYSDDEISEIVREFLDLIQSECMEPFEEIRNELRQEGEKIISL